MRFMKSSLMLGSLFAMSILWCLPLFAEPYDFSCRLAIGKLTHAGKMVREKQRELDKAQREQRVTDTAAEICQPGGIITGARLQECNRVKRAINLAARAVADAETKVQTEVTAFQDALVTVNRRCS